jgi:DNA mismatch repair ATPase MutL
VPNSSTLIITGISPRIPPPGFTIVELIGRTRPSSGEIGTFVVIRNLFKELPVRLAEAKKRKIPVSRVKSLISSYAFVRNVRFVLNYRGNKRIDWSVLGGNPMDVAVSVVGRDVMRGYRHVTWQDENICIEGIVPPLNEGTPGRNLCDS